MNSPTLGSIVHVRVSTDTVLPAIVLPTPNPRRDHEERFRVSVWVFSAIPMGDPAGTTSNEAWGLLPSERTLRERALDVGARLAWGEGFALLDLPWIDPDNTKAFGWFWPKVTP